MTCASMSAVREEGSLSRRHPLFDDVRRDNGDPGAVPPRVDQRLLGAGPRITDLLPRDRVEDPVAELVFAVLRHLDSVRSDGT